LIDNFETITDAAVAEFLQDFPEPSKVLVTTREQKLNQARMIALRGMDQSEALELIRTEGRRIGMDSIEQAPDGVLLPLYGITGGAPLALKWAVGQIKQPGQSLDTVLAALYKAQGDIFNEIFVRSWSVLTPESQRVLMVMSLFAGSASRDAIKTADMLPDIALDEALEQLSEMSLVEVSGGLDVGFRYGLHPLTRVFSESRLMKCSQVLESAWPALADFYSDYVTKYGGFNNWNHFDKIGTELHNILHVVAWCWDHEHAQTGMHILHGTFEWLINYGYWNDALTWGQKAVSVARQRQDELNAARFLIWPISTTLCNRELL